MHPHGPWKTLKSKFLYCLSACLNASYPSSYVLLYGWHSNLNPQKWNETVYKWVNGTFPNFKNYFDSRKENTLDTSVFKSRSLVSMNGGRKHFIQQCNTVLAGRETALSPKYLHYMHQEEISLYNTQHREAINKLLAYFKKAYVLDSHIWKLN